MKRSPLVRRKALVRARLERAGKPPRHRPSGRARPDEPIRTWCEALIPGVCNLRAAHRHHKRRRGQGGSDDRCNTMDVCAACHDAIHTTHVAESYGKGWLIRYSTEGP